ncbi:hypothetical protein V1478_018352 [Vespula squamosa]|uniref:Uncharacterized protein n=1 Tax=Vespula squamosa TaxID=30214 RepID=A0ABD1ZVG6_VESSQ
MADDEKGSGSGGGCRWTKREKEMVMAWWYGSGGIFLLPRRGLTNAKPPFEIHPSESEIRVVNGQVEKEEG